MSSDSIQKRTNGSVDAPSEAAPTAGAAVTTSQGQGQQQVRQRKVPLKNPTRPPTQQQRMLLQMKAQQDLEKEQSKIVRSNAGGAFSNQLSKLVRTMFLVVIAGGGLLYFYRPSLVTKLFRRKPELPPRSLVSVYPGHIDMRRDLPRFFHEYSLAKPENLPAREAIRHIEALRRTATNAGSKYSQKIMLWPWEHEQFRRQLPNAERMDEYCGKGADALYLRRPELRQSIILWCLIGTGHDHGFLHYDVQKVYGSIARGIKGVAVQYDGYPNRIMTNSILLLPFHTPDALKKGKTLPPSTQVPMRTLSWLRQNAPLIAEFDELVVAMEEFLYWAISKEDENSWYLFYAACTEQERQGRRGDPRVASMCTEGEEEQGADCCVIYDPNLHSFFGRAKRSKRVPSNQDGKVNE